MRKRQYFASARLIAVMLVSGAPTVLLATASPATASAAHLVTTHHLSGHRIANTKNATIEGLWDIFQGGKSLHASFDISNEDVATGSFGGVVNLRPGTAKINHYDIVSGKVTGNAFTIVADYPGTIVGTNGLESTYSGTVSGSTMKGEETDEQGWKNGRKIDLSADGDQTFTATRGGFNLAGTVELGCASDANVCSANGTPFEGLEVDVSGTNGSATSTTDNDGKWNVDLPKGKYTITPTNPNLTFTPNEIVVNLTKAITGQTFKACGAPSAQTTAAFTSTGSATSLIGHSCNNFVGVKYTLSNDKLSNVSVNWYTVSWYCVENNKGFTSLGAGNEYVGYQFENHTVKPKVKNVITHDGLNYFTSTGEINIAVGAFGGATKSWATPMVVVIDNGGRSGSVTLNGDVFQRPGAGSSLCRPFNVIKVPIELKSGTFKKPSPPPVN
jgi:hypothetical protein